jgi:hypothetical protein
MATHDSMADAKQIQTQIRQRLDELALDRTVPSWVVRSIRSRVPELAGYAVRPSREVGGVGVEARALRERDIELAVSAYARSIMRWSAVNGRDSTLLLMRSVGWRKSLPCCSQAPIWPFCRGDC